MNKILIIIGLILAVGGGIFALLPADVHMSMFGSDMAMDDHMDSAMDSMDKKMEDNNMAMDHDHGSYVTWSIIVALIGLAMAYSGWKIIE